jgi:hypothetical protein
MRGEDLMFEVNEVKLKYFSEGVVERCDASKHKIRQNATIGRRVTLTRENAIPDDVTDDSEGRSDRSLHEMLKLRVYLNKKTTRRWKLSFSLSVAGTYPESFQYVS